jgi:hypothetical protein
MDNDTLCGLLKGASYIVGGAALTSVGLYLRNLSDKLRDKSEEDRKERLSKLMLDYKKETEK